ncbi:MAG: hypothetical protein AAF467_14515 [Actinomycetota bacterium]
MESDHTTTVATLLSAAGLDDVPADEIERLGRLYGGLRRSMAEFHAVDVGDGVTAAVFAADGPEALDR